MIRLFFVFLVAFSVPAYADNELVKTHAPVKLERVIDGDTIEASGRKIRLWGIDAPEADEKAGPVATMLLESLLKDQQELRCKFIEKDRYQRDVMHCLSDGADIGSMMVQMGMATDYKKYSGGYYQFEEQQAKQDGRGIWKDAAPAAGQVACTMEAKQCPDGSYVSRTGQNCEFAPCPVINDESANSD